MHAKLLTRFCEVAGVLQQLYSVSKKLPLQLGGFLLAEPEVSPSLALMQTDKQSLATDPHSALTPRDLNSRQFVPTFVPCHVTAMHKKIFIVTSILLNTPVQQTNLIYVMASFYAAMSDD